MSFSVETARQPNVIAVQGAIEQQEVATHALGEVLTEAENTGAETDLLDLTELALPPYNPDQLASEEIDTVVRQISRADALVLATSIHHDSYSSQLKNAIDYCSLEEFDSKPIGLIGVTEESGPALALEHLRTVCTTLNALVLPMQVSINASWGHGKLPMDSVNALRTLGQQVVDEASHRTERKKEPS